jgi:hypothetical protein
MVARPGIRLAPKPYDDESEDKPLDPAAERVRRKLVRFVAINLGLLFAAVMVVLAALVYKSLRSPSLPGDGKLVEAVIALPAGARMIGHGFSEGRISIDAELGDGSRAIFLYDVGASRIVGRYSVTAK